MPLAAARNAGARRALEGGADILIFLDVDCVPGAGLVERYAAAAESSIGKDSLLCGTVAYLPPPPPSGYQLSELPGLAPPHPGRPVPPKDGNIQGGDHRLFWSLSFAVTAHTWHKIGGFHEGYSGYGAEDTDFAQTAATAGIDLCWLGGAPAFHQHHATSRPPIEHLEDILRNGALFRQRWGTWPMEGWLHEFARLGLVDHDPTTDTWSRVP
ncbi:galactosyltransferase-related protein [Streptomyces sp. NPDC095817]|uniref:glycosyltransferase family 2 protein n=1 Tax=Streptomyces sp. NPDC095817 TaxID=3155082 RepID=UPI00332F65CD